MNYDQQLHHDLILSAVYIWLQFEAYHPVGANMRVCTRVTVGEVDINVWIFWALMLLIASLFVVFRRRFWQRGGEGAVEHEDLPHPIQVQDD